MMSTFIEPIRIGLQESVRKVSVRVFWDENGRRNQSIEVVQYLTDPAQIEKSMGMGAAGTPGPGGAPGAQTPPGGAANPNVPRSPMTTPPFGIGGK
jgi:hypothetical protein